MSSNRANYEAAVRKLEATLRRQQGAIDATAAQIDMFRQLIDVEEQKLQKVVRDSKLPKVGAPS